MVLLFQSVGKTASEFCFISDRERGKILDGLCSTDSKDVRRGRAITASMLSPMARELLYAGRTEPNRELSARIIGGGGGGDSIRAARGDARGKLRFDIDCEACSLAGTEYVAGTPTRGLAMRLANDFGLPKDGGSWL